MKSKVLALLTVTAATFAVAPCAYGATVRYVANNGVDSNSCGSSVGPCRSISQAIANASDGDTIMVGPGNYGDIDQDGALSHAGDEVPAENCNCMVAINKAVILLSSDGAASTLINADTLDLPTNVSITANAEFGRAGQGFTVTSTGQREYHPTGLLPPAILVGSASIRIRGNVITPFLGSTDIGVLNACPGLNGFGIDMEDSTSRVVIEGNDILGWGAGIRSRGTNKIINQNALQSNEIGVLVENGLARITSNVITASGPTCHGGAGLALYGGNSAISGNNIIGNIYGISTGPAFTGTVKENNIFGNYLCGLHGAANIDATNNFWGSEAGPTQSPDFGRYDVCTNLGTPTVVPFATKPFNIVLKIKP